jgi:hypothetical protein
MQATRCYNYYNSSSSSSDWPLMSSSFMRMQCNRPLVLRLLLLLLLLDMLLAQGYSWPAPTHHGQSIGSN